jgi:hypothetical protein
VLLLTFQTTAAWNMHHDFGASSERRATTVVVRLAEDGTATVTDSGSDRFHDLHQDGRTSEEVTEWSSAWAGTWSGTDTARTLTLSPTAETCHHNSEPCPAPGVLVVSCQQEVLPLEPVATGWRCAMSKGAPHTAGPWLLVEGRCVDQVRGKFSGSTVRWCAEPTR